MDFSFLDSLDSPVEYTLIDVDDNKFRILPMMEDVPKYKTDLQGNAVGSYGCLDDSTDILNLPSDILEYIYKRDFSSLTFANKSPNCEHAIGLSESTSNFPTSFECSMCSRSLDGNVVYRNIRCVCGRCVCGECLRKKVNNAVSSKSQNIFCSCGGKYDDQKLANVLSTEEYFNFKYGSSWNKPISTPISIQKYLQRKSESKNGSTSSSSSICPSSSTLAFPPLPAPTEAFHRVGTDAHPLPKKITSPRHELREPADSQASHLGAALTPPQNTIILTMSQSTHPVLQPVVHTLHTVLEKAVPLSPPSPGNDDAGGKGGSRNW